MKKILVIRKFDVFSRILSENGFETINLPLIETKPLEDLSDFETKLKTSENYNGIFLTSKSAAQVLAAKLDELNINFGGKVYILGKRSFEILKNKNLNPVFFEEANDAEELLKKISADELKNKYFLFVRGEKSLETIPNFVKTLANIDEATVYKTESIHLKLDEIAEIVEAIENEKIEIVCFFSPSQLESFIEQFGAEILHQTKIAAIGKTTAEFFERQSLKVDFVSPKSNAEDFAFGLIEYLRKN